MMVHVPLIFLSEWREFPSSPCLAGKKNLMKVRGSMLLKLTYFLAASVTVKTSNSAHEQTPVSNDNIDSVLRHREVGRVKDLLATPRMRLEYRIFMNYRIPSRQNKLKRMRWVGHLDRWDGKEMQSLVGENGGIRHV
jgi:hypothetical protein